MEDREGSQALCFVILGQMHPPAQSEQLREEAGGGTRVVEQVVHSRQGLLSKWVNPGPLTMPPINDLSRKSSL